ncbi:hypothetical protein K9M74_01640 [Candidatus Woesearchaeota archaeon]|nr:hypothetical protein [Candidatus Woesearchaeota archaeon]
MKTDSIEKKINNHKVQQKEEFPLLFREIATDYFRKWNTLQKSQSKSYSFSKEHIATIVGECYLKGLMKKTMSQDDFAEKITKLKMYLQERPTDAVEKLFIYAC